MILVGTAHFKNFKGYKHTLKAQFAGYEMQERQHPERIGRIAVPKIPPDKHLKREVHRESKARVQLRAELDKQ